MHHQRNACAASTVANMGQPNAGMKLAVQHDWLCQTSHEQTDVQGHHRRVVPGAELHAAVRLADGAVTFGDTHFDQPLDGDRADQQRIPGHGRLTASAA